jgi:polyhydroxyalkanoate synthesis regulator phasin
MTFSEGFKKAVYITVGAVATGIESLGTLADSLAKKGSAAVKKGKKMYQEAREEKKTREDKEEPAVVVEEDNGENAPVEGK